MKIYVVVGHNGLFNNTSARAVYSRREDAEQFDAWFDDQTAIVELELDGELAEAQSSTEVTEHPASDFEHVTL